MGLLDALKKKKQEPPPVPPTPSPGLPPPAPPPPATPVHLVTTMEQQGKTDQEIVQELTNQGYDQTQVYDAIVQARQKGPEPVQPKKEEPKKETKQDVQELVEKIVDERWQDVQKDIAKGNEWKDKMDARLTQLETKLQDFKADLETLHKAIVQKIGQYDRNLMDVGVEIKAMEQVFKKVLPELSSNVQELSRLSKKQKAESKKK